MQSWIGEADIDGFNLSRIVIPDSFIDFVDMVVPELQRRGLHKREYAPGTLREKLFGCARGRLPDRHPAAGYRVRAAAAPEARVGVPPNVH
jgi:alkanesulfonate monooxygenase